MSTPMIWTTHEYYQLWSQRPPPEGWEGSWPPPLGSGPWPPSFPGPPVEPAPGVATWVPYQRSQHGHGQVAPVPTRTNSYKRAPKPAVRSYRRTPSNDIGLDLFDTKNIDPPPDSPERPSTPWARSGHRQDLPRESHNVDNIARVVSEQSLSHTQSSVIEGESTPWAWAHNELKKVPSGRSQSNTNHASILPQQQPLVRSVSKSRTISDHETSRPDRSETNLSRQSSIPYGSGKPRPTLASRDQSRQVSPGHREEGLPGSHEPSSEGPPSPIQTGETDFSKLRRLPHVAELDERARILDLQDPSVGLDIQYFLKLASRLRHEAKNHHVRRRLADAFVSYDRAAIIILQRIPAHSTYFQVLSEQNRENLNANGQRIIVCLSTLEKEIARSADARGSNADRAAIAVKPPAPVSIHSSGSLMASAPSVDTIIKDWEILRSSHSKPSRAGRQDLDMLQKWLDDNTTHPQRQSQIKRLIDYSTQHDDSLPSNLFINGVFIEHEDRPVAAGSFADVYLGVYGEQQVAVKRFRPFLSHGGKDKIYKRFCREALLWRQLRHPRILPFLGIDYNALSSKTALIMISPWMTRGTLLKFLRTAGNAVLRQIPRDLIMDIATGLKYLHDQSLAHGDLHGSNVFVNDHGRALLGDFGLTAITDLANLAATTTVNKAGAIRWLGPELVHQDDGPPPRKTSTGDIFAFGRLCLCVYTRRVPYHEIRSDAGVLLRVIQNRHPTQPTEEECYGTAMPRGLWDLILHCWSADPAVRPTVNEIVKALGHLLHH